jgi:Gpi18-like mannosyltransferase
MLSLKLVILTIAIFVCFEGWLYLRKRNDLKVPMYSEQLNNIILILLGLLIVLSIRFSLRAYVPIDYTIYLKPWYDKIASEGVGSITKSFSNYTPAYLYLISLGTYLPLPPLYLFKIISLIFEFVLAFAVYKIVALKYGKSKTAIFAGIMILCCPTVILNGAVLAQADSSYACFLFFALFFLLVEKPLYAIIAFGLAFSFKLQSIFFALPLAVAWSKRMLKVHFLAIPFILYLLLAIPNLLLGRGLEDILLIYPEQTGVFKSLTLNAPTIYFFLQIFSYETIAPVGIIFMIFSVSMLLYYCIVKDIAFETKDNWIRISLISVLIIPYLLPAMHERYFFMADLLSIVYAFYFPKKWWLPMAIIFCSFMSYTNYLYQVKENNWGYFIMDFRILSLMMGGTIVYLIKDFITSNQRIAS